MPASDTQTATAWTVVQIPMAQIVPNPFQPRLSFDAEEMSDLVARVKSHAVLQAVSVRTALTHPANGNNFRKSDGKVTLPLYQRSAACAPAARRGARRSPPLCAMN